MKSVKRAVLAGFGALLCATMMGSLGAEPAQAFGNPRIIVHVAGTQAGTVEFDNLSPSYFPDLLTNNDTGELVLPTNYCGLNVKQVGGVWWEDTQGNVVEAEHNGEVTYYNGVYRLGGQDVNYFYHGGMEFTGPLETCDENPSWYFPHPLSYGGNGPQFGVARLVLELDQPSNFHPTVEFLDHAAEPVELPDLYEGGELPGGVEEYCEQVPEFCEPEPDPMRASDEMILGGCIYSHGCNPAPLPVAR